MDIVTLCPLRVALLPWQPRPGAFALTVLCKATFELRPEESPLAAVQEPPWDTGIASDVAPFKRRADVFVLGRAYAPAHATSIVARLVVGNLEKTTRVRADRGWIADGLAPLPPNYPARLALRGAHAATWDPHAWQKRPLPGDIDGACFNVAPADQQLGELAGDERIVLDQLHSVFPRLETRLAKTVPRATLQRPGGESQDVRLRCDTLCIDTNRGLAMLVWRGTLVLTHAAEKGRVTVTAETIAPKSIARPATDEHRLDATMEYRVSRDDKPATPFVPGVAQLPPPSEKTASRDDDIYSTKPLWYAGVATVLKPVTPFDAPKPKGPLEERPARLDDTAPLPVVDEAPLLEDVAPAAPVVEKPPMIGPIAVADVTSVVKPSDAPNEGIAPTSEEAAPALPPTELTIDQVATIAAEMDKRKSERSTILASHGLREEDWKWNDQRWKCAIEEEAARGEQLLRERYDAAYVTRIETFRGPIVMDEYARILVGLERGRARQMLDALGIQHEALMPVVRMWTKKAAKEAKLAEQLEVALRKARRA